MAFLDSLPNGSETDTLAPLMASLSLILIAFFILFYSMTVIDESKKAIAVGSLQGSFGYLDGGREVESPALPNAQLLSAPQVEERVQDLKSRLDSYMHRRGIKIGDVQVFAEEKGVDISLAHRLLFEPGSANLSPGGESLMLKVAGLLKELRQVRFDLFDYSGTNVKSATALQGLSLAALRAAGLYRFMVLRGGWPAASVRAFGRVVEPSLVKSSGQSEEYLLLKVIGGIPVYGVDGKGGKIKVGDFTF
ncbi:MAG: hypothetical protein DRH03_08830 [Deltaproteobacteria bacterium]|nr:MAG: hypothetical protein DRH03_08830 [Deltaproteobacteria bacterium]